jgi:WD40 repeat protein
MLASGSTDKTVRVWDIKHNRCIKVLAGHTGQVNAVVTLADEYEIFLCSASHDKSIIVRTWILIRLCRLFGQFPLAKLK